MTILGKQLTAKRTNFVEQPYEQGVVTKVTRNGVFYTTVNNEFTYKWQPCKRYADVYLRQLMFEGKPYKGLTMSFTQLTFNTKETV